MQLIRLKEAEYKAPTRIGPDRPGVCGLQRHLHPSRLHRFLGRKQKIARRLLYRVLLPQQHLQSGPREPRSSVGPHRFLWPRSASRCPRTEHLSSPADFPVPSGRRYERGEVTAMLFKWFDERLELKKFKNKFLAKTFPDPSHLSARRDRALFLYHPGGHGDLSRLSLRAFDQGGLPVRRHGPRRLCQRGQNRSSSLRLGHPAHPSLVGHDHDRGHPDPSGAHLFHLRLPQAAGDQLAGGPRPAGDHPGGCLYRLSVALQPVFGDGHLHRLLHRQIGPLDRRLDLPTAFCRRVSRRPEPFLGFSSCT